MNDSVLTPDYEQIKIADRTYKIGELSLKQFLRVSKFLARTVLSSQKKLQELKERTAGNDSNFGDVMTILDLLDEKDLFQFISIILNEGDITFIEKNVGIVQATSIVAALCEYNSFDDIKKNVQRIVKAVTTAKQQ